MHRSALPFLVLSLVSASPSFAGEPDAPRAPQGEKIVVQGTAQPKERKVCHNEVATGSVMPMRICRTIAEGAGANSQTGRELDRIRDRQQAEQQALMQR